MTTAAERPQHLTVVPDPPAAPPAPLEGAVVKAAAAEPGVLARTGRHVADSIPIAFRGWKRTGAAVADRYHGDWPLLINTVREEYASASVERQEELKAFEAKRRRAYLRHRLIYTAQTGGWVAASGASVGTLTALGGTLVPIVAAIGAWAYGAWRGAGAEPQRRVQVQLPGAAPATATSVSAPWAPEGGADAAAGAQPGEAQVEDLPELRQILAALGFPNSTIVAAQPLQPDGTRTVTFDLGGTRTVSQLKKQTESLAAALGRDITMVDIDKVPGNAGRASLWTASTDPFELPRPSPLLSAETGPIDSWRDGAPVAYGKRGNTIRLPLTNQNFVIAGRTRSGKGVGASNLVVGTAMDPLVNLRIVAGKENGEWDAYAKSGVAATYFKPNAQRLLALIQALIADKNRRERELGKLGKSKLVPDLRAQIGGVELLIIDELATFTRPGKPLRDEILEALIEYSAVAAAAGELGVFITQYPEVDVVPQALSMNCGGKWAMLVENAIQSNAILGAGQASAGRDASKFDPPRPGLGWLVNPFAGITDLARSYDLDEDERGEITLLLKRAATIRQTAGRLAGQWDDPIEQHLLNATGLTSAAGGPQRDGVPGRHTFQLTGEQRLQLDAVRGALAAMDQLGRDEAQLDEMAAIIGGSMTGDSLSALLRAGGAGGTEKIRVPHREGRVNGYRRADIEGALQFLSGA